MYALTDVEENSTASPDMHMINDKRKDNKNSIRKLNNNDIG
jgi:hypothetical protein